MDYQRIRNDNVCPFCLGPKGNGLIACWPCHREHCRNGLSHKWTKTLQARETMLHNLGRKES